MSDPVPPVCITVPRMEDVGLLNGGHSGSVHPIYGTGFDGPVIVDDHAAEEVGAGPAMFTSALIRLFGIDDVDVR